MTITLARLATKFLERRGLSQSTQRSYELTLMPLLAQYGGWPIEIISRQLLSEYLESLAHLSITTHHRHQAIIQALFNFAVEQGYLTVNPIAGLKRRKPDLDKGEHDTDQVVRYLSEEQLSVLYEVVANDTRMHAIVRLLHRTGARIGELLALDLEQVDKVARKFQVVGKGNKRRWCFYSEDALSNYIKRRRKEAHISQQQLATAAGIHLQSLGKLERGKTTKLNQKTKAGLAAALSIPMEYLEAICSGQPVSEVETRKFCPQCWTPGTEPDSVWTLYRAKYCLLCGTQLPRISHKLCDR